MRWQTVMPGSLLIRTFLLVLGLIAWAPGAFSQTAGSGSGDGSGDGSGGGAGNGPSASWFEVDRLNAGLPPAPRTLDRSTPMGAMESFLAAVRDGRLGEAAHSLDLSRIPAEAQSDRGRELARRLGVILESHVWIDWDALPDRPDALLQAATGDDPLAGQMRRSLVVDRLDIDGRAVPLRLNRLKPTGRDPVWVFSRQSVGNIDALYRLYGPGWLAEYIPAEWRTRGWLALQRWEFVALPVLIVATAGAFLLLKLLFRALARRSPWGWVRTACQAACTPLALSL